MFIIIDDNNSLTVKTWKVFHKRVNYPLDVLEMTEIVKVQLLKPTQGEAITE